MKLDYSKIKFLQSSGGLSDRAMARRIGMSHTGYARMMEKRSCTVETLITISEAFNKTLNYFFTEKINTNTVEDYGSAYNTGNTPPNNSVKPDKCTNPECLKNPEQAKDEIIYLQKEIIRLQKGDTHNGKSDVGGVGESRAG